MVVDSSSSSSVRSCSSSLIGDRFVEDQLQAAAHDLICRAEQAVIAGLVKAQWESVLEEAAYELKNRQ